MYRWTVDVETDWGGRTNGVTGIKEGLPIILQNFKKHSIKGLFFVSTELLPGYYKDISRIKEEGHEIGSHGHFHIKYKESWRSEKDKEASEQLLKNCKLVQGLIRYRAPKFNYVVEDSYSSPKGHCSVLKHMWLKTPIKEETIIYLHPFDLVRRQKAPNLFCKLWYSRPEKANETFNNLLDRYHWSYLNQETLPETS